LIGEPFKFTENSRTKTNLMVFLKPHIIRSRADITGITQGKYREVMDVYDNQKYEGTILFPQEKVKIPEEMDPTFQSDVPASSVSPADMAPADMAPTDMGPADKPAVAAPPAADSAPQTMPVQP